MKKLAQRIWIALDYINRSLIQNGQLRSILSGKAQRADGKPIPWLNYAALSFLEQQARQAKESPVRIFEFGSGQSSLFFLRDCRFKYSGVETEAGFYLDMCERSEAYSRSVTMGGYTPIALEIKLNHSSPHVIIVDSALDHRVAHLKAALDYISKRPSTVILLDDANWLLADLQVLLAARNVPRCSFIPLVSSGPCVSYEKVVGLIFCSLGTPFCGFLPHTPEQGIELPHGWTTSPKI